MKGLYKITKGNSMCHLLHTTAKQPYKAMSLKL